MDETPMIRYIALRLGVGRVHEGEHFTSYVVGNRKELIKIFNIFEKRPLNTTKNLNFLMFKEGFNLYYNRSTLTPETCERENPSSANNRITEELASKILELMNQMNKKRVNFQQPTNHRINITPN